MARDGLAVAAGAADLLVVGLERAGQRGVDDGADIGLVDAHAEGDGGDDHLQFAGEEGGLHLLAALGVEAGVIGGGGEIVLQVGGEAVGFVAGGRVDDGGPAIFRLQQLAGQLGALTGRRFDDFDGDVVAAEAVDEAGGFGEPELLDDIVLHHGRGGGGQGDHRRRAEARQVAAEHAVVRPEVVAPLRDAVRLVDRDERRLALGEHLGKARDAQALRRDEEKVELAGEVIDASLPGGGAVAAGVDALDRAAQAPSAWRPDLPSRRSAG